MISLWVPLGFGTVKSGETKAFVKLSKRRTAPFSIKCLTSASTVGDERLWRRFIFLRRGLVRKENRAPDATVFQAHVEPVDFQASAK